MMMNRNGDNYDDSYDAAAADDDDDDDDDNVDLSINIYQLHYYRFVLNSICQSISVRCPVLQHATSW
jgi:hypothetical protein